LGLGFGLGVVFGERSQFRGSGFGFFGLRGLFGWRLEGLQGFEGAVIVALGGVDAALDGLGERDLALDAGADDGGVAEPS